MDTSPHEPMGDVGRTDVREDQDWEEDREPVEELAAEFIERLREGDRPTIREYVARYPEFADEIQELFPTILTMENVNRSRRERSGANRVDVSLPIEQLGDFRLLGEIGRGGMGIVYVAEQVTLARQVAVKVLPKHFLRSKRDTDRFHREAQTAAGLHHTNIVPVFGVGEQNDTHYIVMQLIHGVGLDEIIGELKRISYGLAEAPDVPSSSNGLRSHFVTQNASALLHERLSGDSNLDKPSDDGPKLSTLLQTSPTSGVEMAVETKDHRGQEIGTDGGSVTLDPIAPRFEVNSAFTDRHGILEKRGSNWTSGSQCPAIRP